MRVATVALLGAALAGCGGSGAGGLGADMMPACINELPSSCPSPAPMWDDGGDGGVSALVTSRCAVCHRVGGLSAEWPLDSYAGVFKLRQAVLDQVYSCYMPPPDAGQLDDSQKQALFGWLVCGAPNN